MKKKLLLGLMCGIFILGIATGCGKNQSDVGQENTGSSNIVYYDSSRTLKDSYTFKEAVSKFAFKVNESTLIFEEKDKISLYSLMHQDTIYGDPMNVQFYYKQDIYTSLGPIYLGESNSTTLEQFKNNFNNGVLSDKTKVKVENVNIIESNNDYVFASWTTSGSFSGYEYYFAKIIGDKVYYVYNNSLVAYKDTKIDLLLEEFKQFFTCLSVDDGKEPYIYDKIINVPIVLDKQIKDVKSIYSIGNNTGNGYLDGSVSFTNEDSEFISLEYGASKHYDKINWSKTLDSNVKYAKEDEKNFFGIKDGDNTQILQITIYSDKQIDNTKEFETYMNTHFINK